MILNPDVDAHTKILHHREIVKKTQWPTTY